MFDKLRKALIHNQYRSSRFLLIYYNVSALSIIWAAYLYPQSSWVYDYVREHYILFTIILVTNIVCLGVSLLRKVSFDTHLAQYVGYVGTLMYVIFIFAANVFHFGKPSPHVHAHIVIAAVCVIDFWNNQIREGQ